MNKIGLAIMMLAMPAMSVAQTARGTLYKAPLAGTTVLKDVEDKYNVSLYSFEAESPDGNSEAARLQKVKDEVARLYPHKTSRATHKTTAAQQPVVTKSFQANTTPGIPPDNDFAISRAGQGMSVINVNAAIIDANSGVVSSKGLGLFSSAVGLGLSARYDPKIQYDPVEDKFICVMLHDRDDLNYIVVGFSKTNDPNGTWSWYKFYGNYKNDSTWFDYPGVAITKNEVFITGNKIKFAAPWETGFTESVIYQVDKFSGYAGDANLTYKLWDGIQYSGQSIRNLFPVRPGWMPDTDEQYFLSNRNFDIQNDSIFLVKVPGTIAQGGNVSVTMLQSPIKYGVPPNGRQSDTGAVLATNDGRILGAYGIYDEIQFVSTCVNTVSGASGVYHAKISNYKTNPSISYAQLYSIDTLDFGYPNISFAGNTWGLNQSVINFNYTGPNTHPGMGAIVFDGQGYSDMVKVKEGLAPITGPQTTKIKRWGDYTGTQVDYNSVGSVWIEGIFGKADNTYGNWIVKVNSPAVGIKETEEQVKPNVLYPNPVFNYLSYRFELEETAEITFMITDVTGRVVDKLATKECKKGANIIRFNSATLAAGTYILKGVDVAGKAVMTERFVKQ